MDGEFAPSRQVPGVTGQGGELEAHPAAGSERQYGPSAGELRIGQHQRPGEARLEAARRLRRSRQGRENDQQRDAAADARQASTRS